MVNFDLETANTNELMNEIIRISLTEYNILEDKIAQPIPEREAQEVVDEMLKKYLDNERVLNIYFRKLKRLMKKSPPGLQEIALKQIQLDQLMKKRGLK